MSRPLPRFHDFVGQRKAVKLLARQLDGVKSRGEPFPHTAFFGPSGVGKTLLAKALAKEYGTNLIQANGFYTSEELASILSNVKACDFVFIDECHNLRPKAQELLYGVIDHLIIPDFTTEKLTPDLTTEKNTSRKEVAPCTIILATDQPGSLLNALDKRLQLKISLDYYATSELVEIAKLVATELDVLLSSQSANRIARISHGLPRAVKFHLRNLRNHFPDAERRQLTVDDIRGFMRAFGLDQRGLEARDRKYLRLLERHEKASLETLSSHLGLDADFVRRQVEPRLMRQSLICISSGGRQLTDSGREWISKFNNNGEASSCK